MPRYKKLLLLILSLTLALSGCGTIRYERAHVLGFKVSNLTLGRGVAYELPRGYSALDPYSIVPASPQNQNFENYLRAVTAENEKPIPRNAFNECLLFRLQDRYVVIFHAAINFPSTFTGLPPQQRAQVLPILGNEARRYFATPNKDYRAVQTQHQGNTVIEHISFRINAAGPAGDGWMGTGFSFVGDDTDLVSVFVFAREEDIAAAQADREYILDHFAYSAAAAAK